MTHIISKICGLILVWFGVFHMIESVRENNKKDAEKFIFSSFVWTIVGGLVICLN